MKIPVGFPAVEMRKSLLLKNQFKKKILFKIVNILNS